jgi:hypothetical protein
MLGFILGIGSLVLMMLRNLHAQQNEILFLRESGFSETALFRLHCIENLWLYGWAAVVSLFILCVLALVVHLNVVTLLLGWTLLVAVGSGLIWGALKFYFHCQTYR